MAEFVGDPEFHYDNEDGQEGVIVATMPGWGKQAFGPDFDGTFMLSFDDAPYMDAKSLPALIAWLQGLQSRLESDGSDSTSRKGTDPA